MAESRRCGSHDEHVPHPWAYGDYWCKGLGRYAEDARPAPVPDAGEPCGARYVGPTGVTWVCVGTRHRSEPGGYMGTGHTARAVTGPRA